MKINSRLLVAFLLLLLLPLLFSHIAAYRIGSSMLAARAQQQVESAVAMQKERVAMVMTHNLERLALVLSRTQLRLSLQAFLASPSQKQLERITDIISDARASIASFEAISVATLDGTVVASTDTPLVGSDQSSQHWFARASQEPIGDELFLDARGELRILLGGPLLHEGRRLGMLFITATAADLLAITEDYSGFGATGETQLARKTGTGQVQTLTPLRFDRAAALVRSYATDDMDSPIVQAVAGKTAQFSSGTDYRGREVIAATAYIAKPGWGVAVKIDREEALAPIKLLQIFLACVLVLSLALTSAVSWWLSQTISKPLVRLINAARTIGEGDLSTPLATARSADEIGQLGQAFEEMRQKLALTLAELREQTAFSRMSEARYRELVDNIDSGVALYKWLADRGEFVLVDINKAGVEIYGRGAREKLPGHSLSALYPDAIASGLTATFERVHSTATAELHASYPFPHNQSPQWLQHYLYTLPSGELVAVIDDLTAAKSAEEEKTRLERLNWQLQKNASLHCMAGAIAHHFNNSLGTVIGYLDMILEDWQEHPPARDQIVEALQAANKAATIGGQMLTYLGQAAEQPQVINLASACRDSLRDLRAAVPDTIILHVRLPDSGLFISAAAQQIQQVLSSMVTNAWEAMPEQGQGEIVVTLGTVAAADIPSANRFPAGWQAQATEYALLWVADNGTGIAEENIEKLFDPFFSTKFTGRGLGLPMALGIVTRIGGAIAVMSRLNEGTTFSVFLPLFSPGAASDDAKS